MLKKYINFILSCKQWCAGNTAFTLTILCHTVLTSMKEGLCAHVKLC